MATPASRALIALFVPFTLTTLAACGQSSDDSLDGKIYGSRAEALAAASRLSGSGIESCAEICYVEGEATLCLYVSGYDQDGDGLAVIPWNWENIYEANEDGKSQYGCGDTTPISYVIIASNDDIGADCDDDSAEIGAAGYATYVDGDEDGYGSGDATWVCALEEGDVTVDGDCNDADPDINPGADEICNGLDDDCDELSDDADVVDYGEGDWAWFDGDTDGYGGGDPEGQCALEKNWVRNGDDCDDLLGGVNPAAEEACNEIDDDCDTFTDEGDVCGDPDDVDGDGYDTTAVEGGTDCNDSDASINPGADDVDNDGVDNDCNLAATDWFCLQAIDGVSGLSAQLYWVDYTLYPDTLMYTGVEGTGWLCASVPLVAGHVNKANANVGDMFWYDMLDTNNVHAYSIMGVEYTISGLDTGDDVWTVSGDTEWALHSWYVGEVETGRDLLVELPAALPTAFVVD